MLRYPAVLPYSIQSPSYVYNPFASYAHLPIVRDSANLHEIGSHIFVVDDRYLGISLSCGFDILATGRKSYVIAVTIDLQMEIVRLK